MRWILDGAALLVIILMACKAYRKGFLNTLVRFVGMIFSVAASVILSGPIAEFIFDSWLSEKVKNAVNEHIGNMAEVDIESFIDGLESLSDSLPGIFSNIFASDSGVKIEQWYQNTVEGKTADIAAELMESIITPLATGIIRSLAFIIIFTVLMLLVNIIAKIFIGVNHLPLIGPFNEVLGGMIGAAQGMVYMFVIASVLWFALSASGGQIGPITAEVIEDTLLFKEFYNIGPWVESAAASL